MPEFSSESIASGNAGLVPNRCEPAPALARKFGQSVGPEPRRDDRNRADRVPPESINAHPERLMKKRLNTTRKSDDRRTPPRGGALLLTASGPCHTNQSGGNEGTNIVSQLKTGTRHAIWRNPE